MAFYIWIYAAWFGCLVLARYGWGDFSLAFPILSWAFLASLRRLDPRTVVKVVSLCLVGIAFDATSQALGWIRIEPAPQQGLPLWMYSLWFLFGASLPDLEAVFGPRLFVGALASAVLGPYSYKAGEKFEILYMTSFDVNFIYAAFWALYFPSAMLWLKPSPKLPHSNK